MSDHDEALARARRLLAEEPPQREVPARMHQPPEPEWQDWPPSRQPTANIGKALDKRIRKQLDTLIDAIGASFAKRAKAMQEELERRDKRIADLERRLQQLELDATPNVARLIRGGRDAA